MKKDIIKIALKNTIIYIILLVLLSCIIAYLNLLVSLHIKYAIDGILFNNYTKIPDYIELIFKYNYIYNLLIIAIIIIGLNFLERLLNYFRDRITTKFKLKININLKTELYKHLLNLEYESYNLYDKTEMLQRINEDADVFSNFFNSQFNVILDIIFLSIFIIRESMILNWEISIYILLTIIVIIVFSLWYFKKLNINIENMIVKRKKLLNATIRNINNFKFVRMFNKQKVEKENYKELNNDCCNEEIKFIKLVLFYDITIEHLMYLKSPIIYMIGGISIIKRKNDNGSISFVTYSCRKNI